MRGRLLLTLATMALFATSAFGQRLNLCRTYKVGDKDVYFGKVELTFLKADLPSKMSIEFTSTQEVVMLHDGGAADVVVTQTLDKFSDGDEVVAGKDLGGKTDFLNKSFLFHYDKEGRPTPDNPKASEGVQLVQPLYLVSGVLDSLPGDVEVGKSYAVDFSDPTNSKVRLKGTGSLALIKDGFAELRFSMDLPDDHKTSRGGHCDAKVWIETNTGKVSRFEVNVTGSQVGGGANCSYLEVLTS